MAPRGRPPKLAILKKAEGNRGKRAIKEPPVGLLGMPEPPVYLDAVAIGVWARVVPMLKKIGVDHLDRDVLGIFCQSVSDVERLTREVRGNEVIFSEKGFPLPNPLTVQLEQARKMVVKLSAEFGATPLARARFASKDSAPKDAFEDWEREQAGG